MTIKKLFTITMLSGLLVTSTVKPMDKVQTYQLGVLAAAVAADLYAGGSLVLFPAMNWVAGTGAALLPVAAISNVVSLAYQNDMLPSPVKMMLNPVGALASKGLSGMSGLLFNDASKDALSQGAGAVGDAFAKAGSDAMNSLADEVAKAGPTIARGIGKVIEDGAESTRLWFVHNVNWHNFSKELGYIQRDIGRGINSMYNNWQRFGGASQFGKSVADMAQRGLDKVGNAAYDACFKPKTYAERVAQLRTIAFYGVLMAAIPTVGIAMKEGVRTLLEIIKYHGTKEKINILLPGTKFGTIDRFKLWLQGYKIPSMIFDDSIKERLLEIEEKTRNIRDHIKNGSAKSVYRNLLLYGDPGTGKTFFARILADRVGMDFVAVTAGSLLQSGVEGIKYFDSLMDMARMSRYGLIIFIDEADALFVDRDSLDPSCAHYTVLNHILSLTGSDSNKFMIIAATNHAYLLDEAMGRRFKDHVKMPLPNAETRKELIYLYGTKELLNEKDNGREFVEMARELLTKAQVEKMVVQTEGLSHAEIKDMIQEIYAKADATRDHMIRIDHINRAVAEAVEKCKEKKAFREQKQARLNAHAAPAA